MAGLWQPEAIMQAIVDPSLDPLVPERVHEEMLASGVRAWSPGRVAVSLLVLVAATIGITSKAAGRHPAQVTVGDQISASADKVFDPESLAGVMKGVWKADREQMRKFFSRSIPSVEDMGEDYSDDMKDKQTWMQLGFATAVSSVGVLAGGPAGAMAFTAVSGILTEVLLSGHDELATLGKFILLKSKEYTKHAVFKAWAADRRSDLETLDYMATKAIKLVSRQTRPCATRDPVTQLENAIIKLRGIVDKVTDCNAHEGGCQYFHLYTVKMLGGLVSMHGELLKEKMFCLTDETTVEHEREQWKLDLRKYQVDMENEFERAKAWRQSLVDGYSCHRVRTWWWVEQYVQMPAADMFYQAPHLPWRCTGTWRRCCARLAPTYKALVNRAGEEYEHENRGFISAIRRAAGILTCGGNAGGQPCTLPFEYKGKEYSDCTSFDHHSKWCSVNSTYIGKWGHCECITVCDGKHLGTQCSFPFIYKGKTFHNCTKFGHDKHWCSIDAGYKGRWGHCECST